MTIDDIIRDEKAAARQAQFSFIDTSDDHMADLYFNDLEYHETIVKLLEELKELRNMHCRKNQNIQICKDMKTSCAGYKDGECISIENCSSKGEANG